MRPRVGRTRGGESGLGSLLRREPAAAPAPILHPVDERRAFIDPRELWVGVHFASVLGLEASMPLPLEQVARRAQRFTPRVSLVQPDELLLEVKGSLHLFEGPHRLLCELAHELAAMSLEFTLALAPTPLAALVPARIGKPLIVTDESQLVGQLAPLPLVSLRWPEDVLERLAHMGVRTIGQVLRLPRAGFARRFGAERLDELDRLSGRRVDLRHRFQPRERFRRRRELTYELESNDRILAALAPVLKELGNFLQARQCGLMQLECRLRHRHAEPSVCTLRLAAPMADIARLTELLGERLNALRLPEPVRSCELRSGALVKRVLVSDSLWQPGEHGGGGAPSHELIERLRARLGMAAVYGLRILSGHRPEKAWGLAEPAVTVSRARASRDSSPWLAYRRPLWLLPDPLPLQECEGLPRHRGPLHLCGDVERIETGWWDGADVERDYYTACDIHGSRLWVFRERAIPHRWFLHGVFG